MDIYNSTIVTTLSTPSASSSTSTPKTAAATAATSSTLAFFSSSLSATTALSALSSSPSSSSSSSAMAIGETTTTPTATLYASSTLMNPNSTLLTTSDILRNTTIETGSSLSSFEKFCGNSPFWDTDLLLDGSYPRFTECFQQVAVVWMPCMLYIVACVPYLLYLYYQPTATSHKTTPVSIAKTVCSICLLGVSIATIIVRAADDNQDDIPDALYVSEGLKCASFVLHLLVSHIERRKGLVASPISWLFWLALVILNIIPFYSNIEEDKDDSDEFGFAIFIVYALLVLVALVIASFVERRGKGHYQDLSKSSSNKPSPEYEVSIPNRLSYWWMNSLVILGFKRTLREDDVFDLNTDDSCQHLSRLYQEAMDKQRARLGKYNNGQTRSAKQKSMTYDGALNGSVSLPRAVNEKTPLLEDANAKVTPTLHNGEMAGKDKEQQKKDASSPASKGVSVVWVLLTDHGLLLFLASATKAAFDLFMFLNPKITEALLDYINFKDKYHEWRGYALAACYLGVNIISSLGSNQAMFYTKRVALRLKNTLQTAVYTKSLTAVGIGDDTSKGEIINLMSVDCRRVEDVSNYFFFILSAPVQICLAVYLLYEQLGVAVFAGLAVLVVLIPVNVLIGSFFQRWNKLLMVHKDKRIKLLREMFNGIKVLKLYAWEESFQEKIEEIRMTEVRIIKNISYMMAVLVYIFTALPNLVQVTSYAVYIEDKEYLSPTVAFVSLQLFNLLTPALSILPLLIPMLIQTTVSLGRISKYINKADIDKDAVTTNTNARHAVEIKNGSFTWSFDQPLPTLRRDVKLQSSINNEYDSINMEVDPGSLVAVVGTVGCGKSSLVSAVLGEMEKLGGAVTIKGSVAYVPQEAWIQNGTLRGNIIFGKDFRQRKYDKIIDACALKADLSILPGGDKTEIGEKGINISGGQKQRVSLARAVYSDRDIFLLDDPLSAVDSHVGKHIFQEVIGDKGVLRKKTRILVTHGIQWLPMVDKIFCMAHGQISESGNYNQLMEKNGNFARFIREYSQEHQERSDDELGNLVGETEGLHHYSDDAFTDTSTELARSPSLRKRRKSSSGGVLSPLSASQQEQQQQTHRPPLARRQSSLRNSIWEASYMLTASGQFPDLDDKSSMPVEKTGTKLTEVETGEMGRVKFEIYLYYLQQMGLVSCVVAVTLYLIYAGMAVFSGIWLTEWTSDRYLLNFSNKDTDKYSDKTDEYLGIYAGASIGQGLFVLLFAFVAADKMSNASFVLHRNMLNNVLRSPMSFFDTTPTGRIMNRFSGDVSTLDTVLPMTMRQTMRVFGMVVITITNISYGTPIFLVALLPLGVLYIFIQAIYIPTCRQLRRMNSVTGSPIHNQFSETLSGTASIRAYGCQDRFIHDFMQKVNHNGKFYYGSAAANSWLSFRLQFIGNLVIFAAAIFAVTADDIDASVVGLSVSYATSMTKALEQLVNASSECETNIVSVERLKEYSTSPQEALWKLSHQPRPDWPDKGCIVFDHYQTRYRPGLDLVLKDMTCTIKGGEKIGIVGRTGAGKSSMTVALFRIIEPAGGRIIIDGEDISLLGLHDLRNKITILPQEPVLFSGTLRFNLDPFDKYSEVELWHALEHSYLKEFVESLSAGLEYQCGEEGSNLSVGQRQLVCLARTLLRKTKILVLDEATAAVDMETDDLIQKTIRSEFKECTVLTIAHRLNTIIDYDRVMVLDKGCIKEFDSPSVLLSDEHSVFHGMAKDAGIV